jgi:NAD(P)-dependent dehydrogenase (short-subunit alcohol dehydrogenase family)
MCTVYAARLMVPRKQGLIVNVSSTGGVGYDSNVAYGVGKAAVDRMAIDCGIELRKHNVCMLAIYPGAVKTELVSEIINKDNSGNNSANKTDVYMRIIQILFKVILLNCDTLCERDITAIW